LPDEAMQLLVTLTNEPQMVTAVAKRLRMSRPQLQQVIAANRPALEAYGMHLHPATKSEVTRSIKLPSLSNANEPTYYAKLSRPGAHREA